MEGEDPRRSKGSTVTGGSKPKMPRLYHKKSRTGCQRCRARRVKCNEAKPVCDNCTRHGVPCIYDSLAQNEARSAVVSPESFPHVSEQPLLEEYRKGASLPTQLDDELLHQLDNELLHESMTSSAFDDTDIYDMPESRARRILELRLLQHYISKTSHTIPLSHKEGAVRHAWSVDVPLLALEHDNVLYGMLSFSALHLLHFDPGNPELIIARHTYAGLARREHSKAVATLNPKTADAVCFASSIIFIDSFAALQGRDINPYTPPREWLQMSRGAGSVFAVATRAVSNFENAKILALANAQAYYNDMGVLFAENNRASLLPLLRQDLLGEEWDDKTQQAYERTLSYIGWVQNLIQDGEHPQGILGRMIAFAVLAPEKYIECVYEGRPRALAILVHFFALAFQAQHVWWVGTTVRREIQAIQRVLPREWQENIRAPLELLGLSVW